MFLLKPTKQNLFCILVALILAACQNHVGASTKPMSQPYPRMTNTLR
jgi:hypothetical protein